MAKTRSHQAISERQATVFAGVEGKAEKDSQVIMQTFSWPLTQQFLQGSEGASEIMTIKHDEPEG